mmetsp:Transcript_36384/g.76592  ORF Transcript_36384/g.76592 Transcript_36384/m.76592 type:complete len:280 (-) Transcript_36384:92-931(-)
MPLERAYSSTLGTLTVRRRGKARPVEQEKGCRALSVQTQLPGPSHRLAVARKSQGLGCQACEVDDPWTANLLGQSAAFLQEADRPQTSHRRMTSAWRRGQAQRCASTTRTMVAQASARALAQRQQPTGARWVRGQVSGRARRESAATARMLEKGVRTLKQMVIWQGVHCPLPRRALSIALPLVHGPSTHAKGKAGGRHGARIGSPSPQHQAPPQSLLVCAAHSHASRCSGCSACHTIGAGNAATPGTWRIRPCPTFFQRLLLHWLPRGLHRLSGADLRP